MFLVETADYQWSVPLGSHHAHATEAALAWHCCLHGGINLNVPRQQMHGDWKRGMLWMRREGYCVCSACLRPASSARIWQASIVSRPLILLRALACQRRMIFGGFLYYTPMNSPCNQNRFSSLQNFSLHVCNSPHIPHE